MDRVMGLSRGTGRRRRTARRTVGLSIPDRLPVHVGVVMDGNRRWAVGAGYRNPSRGHDRGADHLEDLLGWCTRRGIDHVTAYVLSADNIRKRPRSQVDHLFALISTRLPGLISRSERWAVHVSGDLNLLPESVQGLLLDAEHHTAGRPAHLTVAVGYDGRAEIATAMRRAAALVGPAIDDSDITACLPGGPVKDIDLVIRTSGEYRLSGFFPWQTAGAEIVVSHRLWPDFTEADFDAALSEYALRNARRQR